MHPERFTAVSALLGSEEFAAKLLDYIDDDDEAYVAPGGALGLEVDEGITPPYYAKNAPIAAHEELLDIPGMSAIVEEGTFATVREFTSAWSDEALLNINTVSDDVLVALGFQPGTATAIADCRRAGTIFDDPAAIVTTAEGCVGAGALTPVEQGLLMNQFGIASNIFRVVSEGIVDDPPARVRVEAIIDRAGETPVILAWRQGAP